MTAKVPALLLQSALLTYVGMVSHHSSNILQAHTAITNCPKLNIECPTIADKNNLLLFKAIVSGIKEGQQLKYNWSVSRGKIKSGQGSSEIRVEGAVGEGTSISVSVEVEGFPEECAKKAWCTISHI
ncbi:MAG TPA: hypothetical protein VFM05_00640 [Candidatus Saccharimonadales bacterium]|nr:hypothetical protein [Candidatus Saccharimonadales bacterium]